MAAPGVNNNASENEAGGEGGAAAAAIVAAPPSSTDYPPLDAQWMEATVKKSMLMLDKLDAELKNHKSNSIKESIRRGYDDLGEYCKNCQ